MTISKEQREKNTHSKNEYIAGVGNKHGEMGKKGRVPQKGTVARSTYVSAHDMGSDTRKEDPEYTKSNWGHLKQPHAIYEHESDYWNKK